MSNKLEFVHELSLACCLFVRLFVNRVSPYVQLTNRMHINKYQKSTEPSLGHKKNTICQCQHQILASLLRPHRRSKYWSTSVHDWSSHRSAPSPCPAPPMDTATCPRCERDCPQPSRKAVEASRQWIRTRSCCSVRW